MRAACRCSEAIRLAIQPSSAFGSPDDLVQRGVPIAARITAAFIEDIADAVDGKRTAKAIRAALRRVERDFDEDAFADAIGRELLMGLMLGALDSHLEGAEGQPIQAEAFSDRRLADDDEEAPPDEADPSPSWTGHPMEHAIRAFEKREIVSPATFKRMSGAAREQSFSISGATSREMLQTAKDELTRVIAEGGDLREFRKFVTERLEGAGWTPANASHVETIFRTNVQQAYSAGRWQQMSQPDVAALRPYLQIVTPNDGPPRQRPNHQAAHGLIFELSDPVFPASLPPWDFNCRCRARSMSARQVGDRTVTPGSWLADNDLPAPGFKGGGRLLSS